MNPLALRKLSSATLPWPAPWHDVFGAARPLIVEIGFGYGHFLEHLSRTFPDASIVGLEISNECLTRAEKAIQRKAMSNTRVVYSTAETALHHLFEPGTIHQVHINFPDPWFKKRHAGRRLMQRDTLDAMVSRLQTDGMLFLSTDILAYAEMSAELLAQTPGLTNVLATPWTRALEGRVVTKYEKKARQQGRDCYYFVCRRNALPAPVVPVIKDLEMPHMVINCPLTLDEMLVRFAPFQHAQDDTRVNVMEAYRGRDALLFEVFVHEPTIDQHGAVVLAPRDRPGEYTLKLSAMGSPRPTEGWHLAVRLLGGWMLSLHSDAAVVHSKVRSSERYESP